MSVGGNQRAGAGDALGASVGVALVPEVDLAIDGGDVEAMREVDTPPQPADMAMIKITGTARIAVATRAKRPQLNRMVSILWLDD
jgi:hypothetical protein